MNGPQGTSLDSDGEEFKNKWNVSFKSEDAMIVLQIASAMTKAGVECVVCHTAQTSEWHVVWSSKVVWGYVVIFSLAYKKNFTKALQQEARHIQVKNRPIDCGGLKFVDTSSPG